MRKIKILLIILASAIINILNVNALDDKTLVVILPANSFDTENCENNLTQRDKIILSVFDVYGTIVNEKGKEIISINRTTDGKDFYKLLPNVTEEDCTIELTEQLLKYIKNHNVRFGVQNPSDEDEVSFPINNGNPYFEQAVEGYTKIKFVVQDKDCKAILEKMIVDFSGFSNFYDLSSFQFDIFENLMYIISNKPDVYPIKVIETDPDNYKIIKTKDNKEIFIIQMDLSNNNQYRLASNLSYLDNFTVALEEEDYLEYGDHIIKEIEFRFGEEPIPETPKDVVVETPNTSETLPAFLYLGSSVILIIGAIVIISGSKKNK